MQHWCFEKNYVAEIKLEITDGWHMVRKVDKTKLLTVVGIIILKILMLLSFPGLL